MCEWDLTILLFILLNSGHDGLTHESKPRGFVETLDKDDREELRQLLGAKGLRGRRNNLFGHTEKWSMDWDIFASMVDKIYHRAVRKQQQTRLRMAVAVIEQQLGAF